MDSGDCPPQPTYPLWYGAGAVRGVATDLADDWFWQAPAGGGGLCVVAYRSATEPLSGDAASDAAVGLAGGRPDLYRDAAGCEGSIARKPP